MSVSRGPRFSTRPGANWLDAVRNKIPYNAAKLAAASSSDVSRPPVISSNRWEPPPPPYSDVFTIDVTTKEARSLRRQLVGLWRLTSDKVQRTAEDGGESATRRDATGSIMYTSDGYMSVQIVRAGSTLTDTEGCRYQTVKQAAQDCLAYSGSYEVGRSPDGQLIVRHMVEHSLVGNGLGQDQLHIPILAGERLVLQTHKTSVHSEMGQQASWDWERVV